MATPAQSPAGSSLATPTNLRALAQRPCRHAACCDLSGWVFRIAVSRRHFRNPFSARADEAESSSFDDPSTQRSGSGAPLRAGVLEFFKLRATTLSSFASQSAPPLFRAAMRSVIAADERALRITVRVGHGRAALDGSRTVAFEVEHVGLFHAWKAALEIAAASSFDKHYKRMRTIGRGFYSSVYLVVDRGSGDEFAVKVIHQDRKNADKSRKYVRREVKILSVTNHENIVQAVDFFSYRNKPHIVLEYLPQGSLKDLINEKTRLSETESRRLIAGVLRALTYLHSLRIVHRDVKPENVMLLNGVAKLTDFGLSTWLPSHSDLLTSVVGCVCLHLLAPRCHLLMLQNPFSSPPAMRARLDC
jgi:predicted Ser/Thr protein kinase